MPTITQLSPAKINLFLHITGKRPDGYHNLQTVFRRINLYDTLTFSPTSSSIDQQLPITLANAEHITDNPTDNLIVQAAQALLNTAEANNHFTNAHLAQLPIVDIHLDKTIPMGAGLGGGSSNCATTLMTLNAIWQLGFTNEQLRQIGATLGADVPFFIFGQDAIAEGIGEILTPIKLPAQQFLLLKPDEHIHTAKLFAHPKLRRDYPTKSLDYLRQHPQDFTDQLTDEFNNVFEPVVRELSASVNTALRYLEHLSTITHTTPRMTGSGSSVFLPIPSYMDDSPIDSQLINAWQQHAPVTSFYVHTL